MSERDAVQSDFVGKTIVRFDGDCWNIWRFWFSDGTAIAIEAENNSQWGSGLQVCEECAQEDDPTPAVPIGTPHAVRVAPQAVAGRARDRPEGVSALRRVLQPDEMVQPERRLERQPGVHSGTALVTDTMRDRLRAKIAEQDAARGRPLTDVERLENLAAALAMPPYTGKPGDMSDDPHDHDEEWGDE